jgi:hypothetical protein
MANLRGKLNSYDTLRFFVMPVKTGIQNEKSEHPRRTIHMLDAGFPMFSYRDCKG